MREKKGSGSLRWLAFFSLALAAVPIGWAWWSAAQPDAGPATTESADAWTDATQLEAQMKPGTDDAALADLSARIGAKIQWNSAVSRDETDVADVILPDGADAEKVLTALRSDPRVASADHVHFLKEPGTEAQEIAEAHPD